MIDPQKRAEKGLSGRPISPGTKHPMKRLLSLVGRAFYFMTTEWKARHFVLHNTQEVPAFLDMARELGERGKLRFVNKDIEGCYPNMPKDDIREGLKQVITYAENLGRTSVCVPTRSTTKPCVWKTRRKGYTTLPMDVMYAVMEFSLDNAIVEITPGEFLWQKQGIPMGDPISPAMTIAACAMMEIKWMKRWTDEERRHFMARRYMDDILLFYAENDKWDAQVVLDSFRTECYTNPLHLEDGGGNTFLETTFEVTDTDIRYWLKNQNEENENAVWRYQHYYSYATFQQKRALVRSCLRKVHKMCSDDDALWRSARAKIAEFKRLQYPLPLLKAACSRMAVLEKEKMWLRVRQYIR